MQFGGKEVTRWAKPIIVLKEWLVSVCAYRIRQSNLFDSSTNRTKYIPMHALGKLPIDRYGQKRRHQAVEGLQTDAVKWEWYKWHSKEREKD